MGSSAYLGGQAARSKSVVLVGDTINCLLLLGGGKFRAESSRPDAQMAWFEDECFSLQLASTL